MDTFKME